MLTIDRYVVRLYVRVLVICFLSLTGLFIVIDAFTHLDEFLRIGEEQGNLVGVLLQYYGARALSFFDRTSALMALVGATFAVVTLQRTNEMAALMAAGIPKIRVVAPLIGGAMVVAVLAAANRELLIPSFQETLTRQPRDWTEESARELHPRYDSMTEILIGGRQTLAAQERIIQPTFRLPPEIGQYGRLLKADDAYYYAAEQGRPAGYLLVGMRQPEDPKSIPSLRMEGRPVLLSPSDTDWLEPDQFFVVSDVTFEHLASKDSWRDYSSTPDLIVGLRNPSLGLGADVRVALHARIVQPLLDVTLFFVGFPVVFLKDSRNVFVSSGFCILVVVGFFLVVLGCHALGNNYLISPALAAWFPLILFVPIARLASKTLWR